MKDKNDFVVFEEILLNGSEIELTDFACDKGLEIVVDWREDDSDVVQYVANFLDQDELSANWTDESLEITYNGNLYNLSLESIGKNRYNTLRKLNEILRDKYEIRVFNNSFGNDTHTFLVRPNSWWITLEKQCPEKLNNIFSVLTDEMEIN